MGGGEYKEEGGDGWKECWAEGFGAVVEKS